MGGRLSTASSSHTTSPGSVSVQTNGPSVPKYGGPCLEDVNGNQSLKQKTKCVGDHTQPSVSVLRLEYIIGNDK